MKYIVVTLVESGKSHEDVAGFKLSVDNGYAAVPLIAARWFVANGSAFLRFSMDRTFATTVEFLPALSGIVA